MSKARETLPELITRLVHAKFGSGHGFQKLFGAAAGLTSSQVSKALSGQIEPTVGTLRKMAAALEVPLISLTDPDIPLPPPKEKYPVVIPGPLERPFQVKLLGYVGAGPGADEPAEPNT